ncbi:MAG: helix-turn-helix domain-containing protein [Pseudolysinimonas sp.]
MTEYNIRLEYQMPPTEESGELLVDTFATFHPASGPVGNGNIDVWLTIQGADAYDVSQLATGLASKVQRPLIALEVLPTTDFDLRNGLTPVPELISTDDAAEMLGVTRQAIDKQIKTGKLHGHRVGERTVVLARADVIAAAARKAAD